MGNQQWALVVSILVSVVGCLMAFIYRDLVRRLDNNERKTAACLMALLLVIGRFDNVPKDLLTTIHEALANGK